MTIYIGNLSFDAEVEDIVGVFSSYGEVTNCKLPLERETGRKRGFAFVDMGDDAQEKKQSTIFKMWNGWVGLLELQKLDPKIINYLFLDFSLLAIKAFLQINAVMIRS